MRFGVWGLAVPVFFGVAATSAGAQEAPAPIKGEVVVTSTPVGTARQTHPGNVAKISESDVEFVRADNHTQLLNRAPGVNMHSNNGQESLTAIRSPVLSGGAGAGSFLFLEDGVPTRAAGFGNVNALFESITETAGGIEIIRGPGSARYGSNALHGLINVLSPAPAATPQGVADVTFGPHGLFQSRNTASTGWQSGEASHGLLGSVIFLEDDGWRASSGYGQQKTQLRYDYSDTDNDIFATFSAHNLNQETASFIEGPEAYSDDAVRQTNDDPQAFRDAWAVRSALHWTHYLNDAWSFNVTPFYRKNRMRFAMHFLPGGSIEENGHWSVGAQNALTYETGGGHTLIFGTDVEYTQGYLREDQPEPTMGSFTQGTHYDYTVDATVLAPYLHTIWQLGPATELTAGVRLEHTIYEYTNRTDTGVTGRYLRVADREDTFTDVTPKLGLAHTFSEEVTGFINLARAARAPQTTDLYRLQSTQVPGEIESEQLDSLEVGARGEIGTLVYEAAAYYMKKKNYFFRDSDGFNVTDGRTKHYGVEIDLFTPLAYGFDLGGWATYAVHEYDFDRSVATSPEANNIAAGHDIDEAPRTLGNIRLGYTFWDGRARSELEWVHMGEYYTNPAGSARYDGHDIFNLRVEADVLENVSLHAQIRNLTDKRYAERADYGFGNDRYFPGEDRALYAGASFRF
ncbi:TonB-dependent receptor [Tepidicaulis sp. LMO-SS28]|uniref:TonB-dependent receptor n=1 Tax=Tepidicaulis sp. LMO-SS28 TaxID=3447455 RepID=UPI003EE39AE1